MLKKILLVTTFSIFYVSSIFSQTSAPVNPGSSAIRINQLGYYPNSKKILVVADSPASSFEVKTLDGKSVFKGQLSTGKTWDKSGEEIQTGDFSKLMTPGKYVIVLNNSVVSHPFSINPDLYKEVGIAAVKTFYLQRASMPIDEKYAGKYKRVSAYPDTACILHPSTGHNSGKISSPGGWYDAGDYNKYVVNAGITLGLLMQLHEVNKDWLSDGMLNIPESGNKVNDLLDEIRYELNWLITMQDADGGVFFKLTEPNFNSFEMPEKSTAVRYVVGKSTTSALCFAAMLAQAARVYRDIDQQFANSLLPRAEKAWNWAVANPSVEFKNPKDIMTGEYGDNDFKSEFFWAACELFTTTGNEEYHKAVLANEKPFEFVIGDNWRYYLPNLGYYTMLSSNCHVPQIEKDNAKKGLLKVADSLLARIEKIPYRIPVDSFVWGSNSDFMDVAIIFAYAHKYTNDAKYLTGMLETTDYIFGKNANKLSYVTGFGEVAARNPHQRLSSADGIDDPLPGFLVGGPNQFRQDENGESWGVKYSCHKPACSYLDNTGSWASNEIAINWNASLAFVTAYIENEMNKAHK